MFAIQLWRLGMKPSVIAINPPFLQVPSGKARSFKDWRSLLIKPQRRVALNNRLNRWSSRSVTCTIVCVGVCSARNWKDNSTWSELFKWHRLYVSCHPASPMRYTSSEEKTLFGHQSKRESIIITLFDKLYWGLIMILRSARFFLTFFPLMCSYPLTLLNCHFRRLWWWLLLVAIETSGPSFIKLGQWASTRRDLFSAEFCDRFSKLHQWVRAHNWCSTETKLIEAFGPEWRDLFVAFDKTSKPVGSGCTAQVYRAFLNPDKLPDTKLKTELLRRLADNKKIDSNTEMQPSLGIPVAVKVCHPGISEAFSRDLAIMNTMANILTFCLPSLRWLSLVECVHEFAVLMEKQIDLYHEAQCLDRFHDNFSSHNSISVARPIWPFVTREVLVETFEDGEHMSSFLQEGEYPDGLREQLARLGIDALLKMVFVDNFVHGDLHPGNILVQNAHRYVTEKGKWMSSHMTSSCSSSCDLRLVLLDVGITASMSEVDKKKFTDVFRAVILGKGEEVAELFLTQSRYSECQDPDNFRKEMTELVKAARSETIKLGTVKVGELLSQVFGLLSNYKLKMESNFASIILAIAVLEGLGRSLDPELDVLERAKPFLLSRAWKR